MRPHPFSTIISIDIHWMVHQWCTRMVHFELSRMIWCWCNQVSEEENTKHGGSQPYNWAAYEIGNILYNWYLNGWRKYWKSNHIKLISRKFDGKIQNRVPFQWKKIVIAPSPIIQATLIYFFIDFLHRWGTCTDVCTSTCTAGSTCLPTPPRPRTLSWAAKSCKLFKVDSLTKKIRYHKNYR